MTIRQLDLLVALLLIGFGAYLVSAGLGWGFMQGTTPGAGFFPVIMGVVIGVLSLVNLARALLDLEKIKVDMTLGEVGKFAGVAVAMLVFVVLTDPLGITVATMLLMAVIGFIIRPSLDRPFLLRLGLSSVLTPVACKFLFANVLQVPLPTGLFGF